MTARTKEFIDEKRLIVLSIIFSTFTKRSLQITEAKSIITSEKIIIKPDELKKLCFEYHFDVCKS